MKFCTKCLFPDTKPDIFFDKFNKCDACISAERKHNEKNFKKIDWSKRELEFSYLLEESLKISSKNEYDCIVPVSGGKDSIWQVYAMSKIHNLRTLAVTFDQFDQTPIGLHNLNALKEIGVDHLHFTLNPKVIRDLVYKGFEIIGDPYWVNHVGIWTVPMHIAVKFKVPLVVYGENPIFEYGGPDYSRDNMIMNKKWRQEFGGMRGIREEDMVDDNITSEDLKMLVYPKDEDIEKYQIKGIFYGHFFKWEPIKHTKFVMNNLNWKPLETAPKGSWMTQENCDMQFIDIRERIKYLKYGYGRATDQLNIAIRQGVIQRDEALKIVKNIDGEVDEENVIKFCKYLMISKEKYEEIIDSFVNQEIFYKNNENKWIPKEERY